MNYQVVVILAVATFSLIGTVAILSGVFDQDLKLQPEQLDTEAEGDAEPVTDVTWTQTVLEGDGEEVVRSGSFELDEGDVVSWVYEPEPFDFEYGCDIEFLCDGVMLMAYRSDEKRWTFSDQFFEDLAKAMVPVMAERGFLQVGGGDIVLDAEE